MTEHTETREEPTTGLNGMPAADEFSGVTDEIQVTEDIRVRDMPFPAERMIELAAEMRRVIEYLTTCGRDHAARKEAAKTAKERLDGAQAEVNDLAAQIGNGTEPTEVKVVVVRNYTTGTYTVMDQATAEVYEQRPLELEETQASLTMTPVDSPDEPPAGLRIVEDEGATADADEPAGTL